MIYKTAKQEIKIIVQFAEIHPYIHLFLDVISSITFEYSKFPIYITFVSNSHTNDLRLQVLYHYKEKLTNFFIMKQ